MIVAATFAAILELFALWQNLWLAICISFALLFLVGGIRFGSELSLKSWRALKASYVEPVGASAETQVVGSAHESCR
jgi:hypothetical protein